MQPSRQVKSATRLAERLGKRHGVPYLIVSLSVEQHGASQPLTPAQTAALMAAEGAYVLAVLAEHPDLIPTSRPQAARRLARQVSRRLRSAEAERSSVFFAHALLTLVAAMARAARDDGTALVTAVGREQLSEHYPLGGIDRDHLTTLEGGFTRPVVGITAPDLAYAAPVFVGRAAAHGLGILLGASATAEVAIGPVPGMDQFARLLSLYNVWCQYSAKQLTVLRERTMGPT
jgi:hypothetical protein